MGIIITINHFWVLTCPHMHLCERAQTLLNNAPTPTHPWVQSSAPHSCVSALGVSCRIFLAICVKLKNTAMRTVKSADVKTHLSAVRAKLYLRTASEGGVLKQREEQFTELSACAIQTICFSHFTHNMLFVPNVDLVDRCSGGQHHWRKSSLLIFIPETDRICVDCFWHTAFGVDCPIFSYLTAWLKTSDIIN